MSKISWINDYLQPYRKFAVGESEYSTRVQNHEDSKENDFVESTYIFQLQETGNNLKLNVDSLV